MFNEYSKPHFIGIQEVLHQKLLYLMSKINLCSPFKRLYTSPTFQRLSKDENGTSALAYVFVIFRASFPGFFHTSEAYDAM